MTHQFALIEISPEMLRFITDVTPLGLLALCCFFAFIYGVMLVRDRREERKVREKIALAEQATLRQRDEATEKREQAFFASIASIADFTDAVKVLVSETTRKDKKAEEKDAEMIRALQSITLSLNTLDENYTLLVSRQSDMLDHQLGIKQTVADDLNIARQLLDKMNHADDNITAVLDILRRLEKRDEQVASPVHDIVTNSVPLEEKETVP